jgi:hypothetical protein
MTLMNLAQAKKAAGTKEEVRFEYNGPSSWPTAPQEQSSGAAVARAPKIRDAPIKTKHPEPAPAKEPATPPYTVPMFVPMDKDSGVGPEDKYAGPGKPEHMATVETRGHFLGWTMGFGQRESQVIADSDSYTGIYSSYFWAAFSFVMMIITYFVHPYIAAVFAYLYGHFWSEYLLGNAWGIAWLKGKSLVYAY